MTDDIVKRLKSTGGMSQTEVWETIDEAAADITALRAEVERLKDLSSQYYERWGDCQDKLFAAEAERDRLREALDGVLWMAEQWYEHGGNETTLADEYLVALEKARALTTKGEN